MSKPRNASTETTRRVSGVAPMGPLTGEMGAEFMAGLSHDWMAIAMVRVDDNQDG